MSLRDNLLTHLQNLVRDRNPYLAPQGHFFAKDYISTALSEWGTVELQPFTIRQQTYHNLVLTLPASQPTAKPPILIGAHFDTVPGSPGADDNATGVAALLELARLFATRPTSHPICLVAFDLEEMGLLGSKAFVQQWQQQGRSLRLMLSLEMLGYCTSTPGSQTYPPGLKYFYPNRGDFIALIGNLSTLPDLLHLSHHLKTSGPVPCQWLPAGKRGLLVPDVRRSDHAPFWDANYRAIMVTDTANLRNPHYHTAGDRLNTLNLDFLTGVCQGLEAGIRSLR